LRGMPVVTALVAAVWLSACAEADPADSNNLQLWMQSERAKHAPPIPHVPALPAEAVQPIHPQPEGVEPFNRQRLLASAAVDAPRPAESAQLERGSGPTRPPLDALPLAGMRLVGSLQRGGETLALLRVQGLIYPVRVGDKIGQDQGRVNAITWAGLVVREIARNPQGEPSERVVSLALVPEP
jgi:type IV pilus assembly protein PilP